MRAHTRARFWVGLSAVFLIAAGAVAAALIVHADDRGEVDQIEREEAAQAAHQAEAVSAFSVGQLSSAAAFVQAEEAVSEHDFEVIGRSLLEEGVLDSTAYLPRVSAAQRGAYERQRGLTILERDPAGELQPAKQQGEYFPLTYAVANGETQAGLRRAYGFDLGSDPERAPYLRRARDTGKAVSTSPLSLVLGGKGINVYRAIYRDDAPIATRSQRRAALIGFIAGGFRIADLARTAVATLPANVDIQVEAGKDVIFGAGELDDASAAQIQIADRSLILFVRDPDGPDVSLPLLLGIVGLALAAVLGALITVWSRNERMGELEREASQDPLTGLKNRRRFDEDLRTAMARARRERSTGAMLMLDLDHFKRVNDDHGHPAGDRLIVEIAEVLRRRTRESDSLGRLGGDEFAVVLPRCSREEALLTAEAIARAIRDHEPVGEGVEAVTACVGVAMFGEDSRQGAASVASQADAAMYAAKDGGRDGVRIFDPGAVREDHPH